MAVTMLVDHSTSQLMSSLSLDKPVIQFDNWANKDQWLEFLFYEVLTY